MQSHFCGRLVILDMSQCDNTDEPYDSRGPTGVTGSEIRLGRRHGTGQQWPGPSGTPRSVGRCGISALNGIRASFKTTPFRYPLTISFTHPTQGAFTD
ncbi:hypothetical protein ACOMHN_043976 [Nucella lapillus]